MTFHATGPTPRFIRQDLDDDTVWTYTGTPTHMFITCRPKTIADTAQFWAAGTPTEHGVTSTRALVPAREPNIAVEDALAQLRTHLSDPWNTPEEVQVEADMRARDGWTLCVADENLDETLREELGGNALLEQRIYRQQHPAPPIAASPVDPEHLAVIAEHVGVEWCPDWFILDGPLDSTSHTQRFVEEYCYYFDIPGDDAEHRVAEALLPIRTRHLAQTLAQVRYNIENYDHNLLGVVLEAGRMGVVVAPTAEHALDRNPEWASDELYEELFMTDRYTEWSGVSIGIDISTGELRDV